MHDSVFDRGDAPKAECAFLRPQRRPDLEIQRRLADDHERIRMTEDQERVTEWLECPNRVTPLEGDIDVVQRGPRLRQKQLGEVQTIRDCRAPRPPAVLPYDTETQHR